MADEAKGEDKKDGRRPGVEITVGVVIDELKLVLTEASVAKAEHESDTSTFTLFGSEEDGAAFVCICSRNVEAVAFIKGKSVIVIDGCADFWSSSLLTRKGECENAHALPFVQTPRAKKLQACL